MISIAALAACARIESTGPPTARQLATACIKYAACGATSVIGCLDGAPYAESLVSVYRPNEIRCLANAAVDCNAQLACIEDTCSGDFCEVGACDSATPLSCNGDRIEMCGANMVLSAYDCSIYGETCKQTFGQPYCGMENAGPCTISHCEGDVLIRCDGEAHRIDCAGLYSGGVCVLHTQRCAFADECSPSELPSCVGDSVHACVLGEVVEINCRELGFARCSDGACSTNYARRSRSMCVTLDP